MQRPFIPNREPQPGQRQQGFIRSENKHRSVWQYLKRYGNKTFVKARIDDLFPDMNEELKFTKSRHITECIRQAEQYFLSASSSDLSIKPLLLYYGMLQLVKALLLLGDNELTLDDETLKSEGLASHGLTHGSKGDGDAAIRDSPIALLEEYCYVAGRSGSRSIYQLLHKCWSANEAIPGSRFTIADLASMHPSSYKSFSEFTGSEPKLYPAQSGFRTTTRGDEHFIMFGGAFNFLSYTDEFGPGFDGVAFFKERLPKLEEYTHTSENGSAYCFYKIPFPESLEDYQPIYRSETGASYTMTDCEPGYQLHPIEVEFIQMFILGSLTRYAPQKWLANVRYETTDAMFVIEGFINSVTLNFPKMILEELDYKDYTFTGDVAYLS